jgi:hypothetical protein
VLRADALTHVPNSFSRLPVLCLHALALGLDLAEDGDSAHGHEIAKMMSLQMVAKPVVVLFF